MTVSDDEKVAREVMAASITADRVAKKFVAGVSVWQTRERRINQEMRNVVGHYQNLLFDMMKAGEISDSQYESVAMGLFRRADALRDLVIKFTGR